MANNKMVSYPAGSLVLKEGELDAHLYKIISGHAEVYTGYGTPQENLLGILKEQACFGEMGLLLGKPAIYTVIAYDDMLVLKISDEEMDDFIMGNQKNVLDIMRNMANGMYTMRFQIDMLMDEITENSKSGEGEIYGNVLTLKNAMRQYALGSLGAGNFICDDPRTGMDKKI